MKKSIKNIINTAVFLAIGIALFYWALADYDIKEIIADIKAADSKWILLAMLCGVLSHLARSLRWNLMLEPMGYKAQESAAFHAVIIGYLANMAGPRFGEVARPAVLSRIDNIPFNKLVGTVVMERVVDMLITILIAISIFFLQFDLIADFVHELFADSSRSQFILYIIIALVLVLAFILTIYFRKYFYRLPIIARFKSFFEGIVVGLRAIFKLKRVGLFVFYSLFIWLMYFFMPYLV